MGTNSLINGIRERLGEAGRTLFAWPPKFRLPSAVRPPPSRALAAGVRGPARVDPARIWACASVGWRPLAERLRDGETLRITHLDDDRFRLDASQRDDLPAPDTFPNWIVTEESEDGAIARLSFDDYAWKDRMYAPNNLPLALAAVTGVEDPDEAPGAVLRLELKPGRLFRAPQPGTAYLLEQRYTDYNVEKVLANLAELDRRPESAFVNLIERPQQSARPLAVDPSIRRSAPGAGAEARHDGEPALGVRGDPRPRAPPGLGSARHGQDPLPRAVDPLPGRGPPCGRQGLPDPPDRLHPRGDRQRAAQGRRSPGIPHGSSAASFPSASSTILGWRGWRACRASRPSWARRAGDGRTTEPVSLYGGTVWKIHKGDGADRADLVVVDEGSQLRVPEASMVLGGLKRDSPAADRRRRQAAPADHPGDVPRPRARRAGAAPSRSSNA